MVCGFIIWLLCEKVNSKIRLFRDKRVTDALIQFVVEHNVINAFELMQHDFRFGTGCAIGSTSMLKSTPYKRLLVFVISHPQRS